MIRRQAGFTLVELMITMVLFVLVIAATSQVLTGLLTQFKQQSKIAETNIEGVVGLDMLRRDLGNTGYGIPWVIPATITPYNEVPAGPGAAYNECAGACTAAPRAVVAGSGAGWNGSDELVIRGSNVARTAAAQAWTVLSVGNVKRDGLSGAGETLAAADGVIVISPGSSTTPDVRRLVVNSGSTSDWDTRYDTTANFAPVSAIETRVIYGIDAGNAALRMPFNRTDYFISSTNVPSQCAPNTGVLMKSVLSHATGLRADFLPLLDCVADMQVVFRFDTSVPLDGLAEIITDDIVGAGRTAQQVREQLMDIRVYILAHEGQRDPNFTYTTNPVTVGEFGAGRPFNFTTVANPIADWQNYRWKIYTIVVKPNNLRW